VDQTVQILHARHVVPRPGVVIENGAVVVLGRTVLAAGPYERVRQTYYGRVLNFGNAAIIPGLVNAHTHLELTGLRGKLKPTKRFTDWIRHVIRLRAELSEADLRRFVKEGAQLSLAAGTTTIGDMTTGLRSLPILSRTPLRGCCFAELVNFNPSEAASVVAKLRAQIPRVPLSDDVLPGVAPHAPYTASVELFRECHALAAELASVADTTSRLVAEVARLRKRRRKAKRNGLKSGDFSYERFRNRNELGLPMATHLAETKAEVEFLTRGTGEFADLLRERGMLRPDWTPPRLTPVKYLQRLGVLNRCVLAHGNYLAPGEPELLRRAKASVVFCPRSHTYFGHAAHPWQKLLRAGVNVALGTDSLASNDSLSILHEMKFLAGGRKGVKPETLLTMATMNGAKALGLEGRVGCLEAGYEADLAVVALPAHAAQKSPRYVLELVLAPDSRNVFTMVAGRMGHDALGVLA